MGLIGEVVDKAFEAVFQAGDVEVDQKSQPEVAELKVRQDLCNVHRGQGFDGLDFHDDPFRHQQVRR